MTTTTNRKLPAWMRATRRALDGTTTAEQAYDVMQGVFARYNVDREAALGYVAHIMLPRLAKQQGTVDAKAN